MNSSLKNKGIHGIKWSFVDNIANSGISFIIGLILARLLSPTEFGILGLIGIFITVSNAIIDGGFTTALLRKETVSKQDYNTAFYSNLLISFFLFIILISTSKAIADFFQEPILIKIIPIMSSLLIINALTLIQRTIYIKKIDFKTQAKVSLIASIGSGFLAIGAAFSSFGVWSLVILQISRQILISVFLWIYSDWRPGLNFSKESFNELFGFGVKILGANFINSLYQNIYILIIGKIYTVEQLGQYTRAEQFNTILSNNLTSIVQRVTFPMLSSVQSDKERTTRMFRKIIIYSSIITFTLVASLAAIAKPLILFLIGEKWVDSILYLQIISCYAILYPLQNLNLNMLNIASRSDLVLILEIIKKIFFIPVFIIGMHFNIKSMLWAAVVYYYFEYFLNTYFIERYYNYGIIKQIKDLFPILIITICVVICIWSITLLNLSNTVTLLIQIPLGALLFYYSYEFSNLTEYKELKKIIKDQYRNISFKSK